MLGHQNDCVPNNVISPFQPKREKRTNLGAKTKDREDGSRWEVQFNSVLQFKAEYNDPGQEKAIPLFPSTGDIAAHSQQGLQMQHERKISYGAIVTQAQQFPD